MYTAAAGVVEQPIKQSPRSQGRQASCLNCSWCHLHTFQKSDWNIFLSVPSSLQSPANVLTQPNCPPERPLERHEWVPASSGALVPLAGGFPLSFGTTLTRAPDEAKGSLSLHPWCNTEFCTHSPASLLMLLGLHHQHFQYMLSADFPSLVLGSGPHGTPRCPVTAWVGTGDLLLLTFPGWQQNN